MPIPESSSGFFNSKLGRIVMVIAGIGVLAGICVPIFWKEFAPPPSGKARPELICESCGNRWQTEICDAPKCSKCGGAGYSIAWYICPSCTKVFQGMETKRISQVETYFRLPGDTQWGGRIDSLTCPECKFVVTDLLSAFISSGWNPPPPESLPKTPRRVQ